MARFQNHFSKRAELFLTYDDVFFKLLFVNLLRLTSCWGRQAVEAYNLLRLDSLLWLRDYSTTTFLPFTM